LSGGVKKIGGGERILTAADRVGVRGWQGKARSLNGEESMLRQNERAPLCELPWLDGRRIARVLRLALLICSILPLYTAHSDDNWKKCRSTGWTIAAYGTNKKGNMEMCHPGFNNVYCPEIKSLMWGLDIECNASCKKRSIFFQLGGTKPAADCVYRGAECGPPGHVVKPSYSDADADAECKRHTPKSNGLE
jgi:hypothetical protein